LQGILAEALRGRAGADVIRVGQRLQRFRRDGARVEATFADRTGEARATITAPVLVGADGIHSTVRSALHPDEGPPRWNGSMMWRGATPFARFLDGRTMLIAGGMGGKLVVYPIAATPTSATPLTNWAMVVPLAQPGSEPPRREDWSRPADRDDVLRHVPQFHSDVVDVRRLVEATAEIFEYPMCDRDPLPRWSHGGVTLLGDAAHPMYPMGSNGATQALLDGRSLADHLAGADVEEALQAFDAERRPATSRLVELNRVGGPERVIDLIEQMAPDGFEDISDVVAPDALRTIVADYATATTPAEHAPIGDTGPTSGPAA
jgi:2-polyprenyl-6-methoxyphenol hydroxylase-like FAD-dependent oxidoreductase